VLTDAWVTAAVKCAPPNNRPSPQEIAACAAWLTAELDTLDSGCVILALGDLAYRAVWRQLDAAGRTLPRPRPPFAHGARIDLGDLVLLTSYHPSQQNTFTGKLTEDMLDRVLIVAREALDAR